MTCLGGRSAVSSSATRTSLRAARIRLGLPRVVTKVSEVEGKIVVETEPARLEDIFTGGFAVTVLPDDAGQPDLAGVDLSAVAATYYQNIEVLNLPGEPLRDNAVTGDDPYVASPLMSRLTGALGQGILANGTQVLSGDEPSLLEAYGGATAAARAGLGDTWNAVSADLVAAPITLQEETRVDFSAPLLDLDFTQEYVSNTQSPFTLSVRGRGALERLSVRWQPGLPVFRCSLVLEVGSARRREVGRPWRCAWTRVFNSLAR